MTKVQKNEPLLNTSLGLLPWLFFILVQNLISYKYALIAGSLSWLGLMFYFYKIKKNQAVRILLKSIGLVLIISSTAPLLQIPAVYDTVFSEVILLFFLWIFNTFKSRISRHYLRYESTYTKKEKTISLNEMFYVIRICWNTLFLHIIIVFIYFILPENFHTTQLDVFIYEYLGILLTFMVILYEHIRLSLIKKKLDREDWLPVANEAGRIIGKVAKSISLSSGNKLLHPLIRIALVHKGKLFLSERPQSYMLETGRIDHPFEKHLEFNQSLEEAIGKLIPETLHEEEIKTRFAFKYIYKNSSVSRLVYLYTLPIHREELMQKIRLPQGRIWTEKQIEENLNKNLFSEFFEKEYDILKNTILMAEKIVCSKQA